MDPVFFWHILILWEFLCFLAHKMFQACLVQSLHQPSNKLWFLSGEERFDRTHSESYVSTAVRELLLSTQLNRQHEVCRLNSHGFRKLPPVLVPYWGIHSGFLPFHICSPPFPTLRHIASIILNIFT